MGRERKRKRDDVHFPMGGRGKRATRPKCASAPNTQRCPHCGMSLPNWVSVHLCTRMPFSDRPLQPSEDAEDGK